MQQRMNDLIDKFTAGLASALYVSRTKIALADFWLSSLPDGPMHPDIAVRLGLVYR